MRWKTKARETELCLGKYVQMWTFFFFFFHLFFHKYSAIFIGCLLNTCCSIYIAHEHRTSSVQYECIIVYKVDAKQMMTSEWGVSIRLLLIYRICFRIAIKIDGWRFLELWRKTRISCKNDLVAWIQIGIHELERWGISPNRTSNNGFYYYFFFLSWTMQGNRPHKRNCKHLFILFQCQMAETHYHAS